MSSEVFLIFKVQIVLFGTLNPHSEGLYAFTKILENFKWACDLSCHFCELLQLIDRFIILGCSSHFLLCLLRELISCPINQLLTQSRHPQLHCLPVVFVHHTLWVKMGESYNKQCKQFCST